MSVLDSEVMDRWVEEDTVVDMNVGEVANLYVSEIFDKDDFLCYTFPCQDSCHIFALCRNTFPFVALFRNQPALLYQAWPKKGQMDSPHMSLI